MKWKRKEKLSSKLKMLLSPMYVNRGAGNYHEGDLPNKDKVEIINFCL